MSMTAAERTEALCRQRGIYMGHEGPITAALRAHANAALEEAWKASASIETTGKDPQRVQDEMLAAIRTVREEE